MTEQTYPPLPPGWIEQLRPLLGGELPVFLDCMNAPAHRGIRMRPELPPIGEALSPVPWADHAWYLPAESEAGKHPLHEAGAYYLQEPSAMIPAAALRPAPGERVLDLCAAPGGKSTQLAAYMAGRGVLVCNEPVPARAKILSRNLERMGVRNAVAVSALPEELAPLWEGYFDRILVDAPCSGEGMFRRHPETRSEWTEASPAGCARRQEHILSCAARMLRPGGRLAYSTCTLNAVENEGVIAAFLASHPDFSLVPFALPGLPPCDGRLRLWPHRAAGEGHFAALLEKGGHAAPPPAPGALPPPAKADAALARKFLQAHIEEEIAPNAVFAGHLVCAPRETPPLRNVRMLRLGLHLGDIRGKLFFPDHALALACPSRRPLPLDEGEAAAYQRGEALPVSDSLKGYFVPTLDGVALGWGKASGGQLKNHYPKGLRR